MMRWGSEDSDLQGKRENVSSISTLDVTYGPTPGPNYWTTQALAMSPYNRSYSFM